MDLRRIFINDFGRLRSGWRVLTFVLAFIATLVVLGAMLGAFLLVVNAFSPSLTHDVSGVLSRVVLLAAALIAGYLCVRFLEGLPFRSLGATFHHGWFRDFLIGSAIGVASLIVAVAIAALGGGLHFSLSDRSVMFAVGRSLLSSAFVLIIAAFGEEAMFRGYGLQTLTRAQLAWLGVLLTSVPFALIHLKNPNVVPVFTFINTALAGIWLAVAYLRTRSLWFPLGVHWAWNWALGWLFGLPVSGLHISSHPFLNATDAGPFWLTGGSYGIEGGVACAISLTIFTIFIWRTSLVSADPELKKLTSEENPATPKVVLTIRPADDHA